MKLKDFSNYEIDIENGTIYSYKSNTTIGHLNSDGYVCTTIYDDSNERHTVRNHRIIWEVVNGEIPQGYDIHHIDGNRANNTISNLQLKESSEHKSHHFSSQHNPMYGKSNPSARQSGMTRAKKVGCFTEDGKLIKIYSSTRETLKDGFIPANVSHCCNGKYNTHKGYKFQFMG